MRANTFRRPAFARTLGSLGAAVDYRATIQATSGAIAASTDITRADQTMLRSAARQAPSYIDHYAQLTQNALTFGVPEQYLDDGKVVTTERAQTAMYQGMPFASPFPGITPGHGTSPVAPIGTRELAQAMLAAQDGGLEPALSTPRLTADVAAVDGTARPNEVAPPVVPPNGAHTLSLPFGLRGWQAALIIGGLIATGAGAYWLARR